MLKPNLGGPRRVRRSAHQRVWHPPSHARKPVIALIFPKSAREGPSHLDRLQVLGAFESELGGDSQPYRGTPRGREGLPVEIKCQDRLWVQCAGHVDAARRVTALGG